MVSIDLHCMDKNVIFYGPLNKKSYKFEMAWGWVNNVRISILTILNNTKTFSLIMFFRPSLSTQMLLDALWLYFPSKQTIYPSLQAMERANGMELDGRRIRVDYSITKRPHTPTPGIYMGRPTQWVFCRPKKPFWQISWTSMGGLY